MNKYDCCGGRRMVTKHYCVSDLAWRGLFIGGFLLFVLYWGWLK